MAKIRVVIAEDEANYRKALRRTIEVTSDISIVAECGDGQEAYEKCLALKPDVLLTDLGMPRMSGIELIARLLNEAPDVCVVVLTVQDDDETILDAFRAGACGYLLKTATPQDVLESIRYASRGEAKLTPRIAARLIDSYRQHAPAPKYSPIVLSGRESEILKCMAAGMRNREIAEHLEITEKTVKNHVSNILKTLSVTTRTEAALKAVKHNIVANN